MRYKLIILVCLISNVCFGQLLTPLEEIKHFRAEKYEEATAAEGSPLAEEDKKSFKGFHYFEPNLGFRFEGTFKLTPGEPVFEMKTSTKRLPKYRKYGEVSFEYEGKTHVLAVYQSIALSQTEKYADHLFIPFKDHTNGLATYGGGRFMDVTKPEGNTLLIDFNMAYNPYCAYNHVYSCPIPPEENHLDLPIEAGEKRFKDDSH